MSIHVALYIISVCNSIILTIPLMAVYSISGVVSPLEPQERVCKRGVVSSRGGSPLEESPLY